MNTEEVTLTVTREEINLIIKALSNEPFKEVYNLIGKIHQQVSHNDQIEQ